MSAFFEPHVFKTSYRTLAGKPVNKPYSEKEPLVLIYEKADEKMQIMTGLSPVEGSWFCEVIMLEDNVFQVVDTHVPGQEVHQVQARLTEDGLAELSYEFIAQGAEGLAKYDRLQYHEHSHGWMGTGPSGRDNDQMREFSDRGFEWFIRSIVNKRGERHIELFHYKKGYRVADVPWRVVREPDPKLVKALTAEFDRKVKEVPRPTSNYVTYSDEWGQPNTAIRLTPKIKKVVHSPKPKAEEDVPVVEIIDPCDATKIAEEARNKKFSWRKFRQQLYKLSLRIQGAFKK